MYSDKLCMFISLVLEGGEWQEFLVLVVKRFFYTVCHTKLTWQEHALFQAKFIEHCGLVTYALLVNLFPCLGVQCTLLLCCTKIFLNYNNWRVIRLRICFTYICSYICLVALKCLHSTWFCTDIVVV